MSVQRLYIYRNGATNGCALTGEKSDSRLPAPLAPDRWQFWMQTSRHQTENGLYGFGPETASAQIAATGYYLFTGSTKLLDARIVARSATLSGPIDVEAPFARQSPEPQPHPPTARRRYFPNLG